MDGVEKEADLAACKLAQEADELCKLMGEPYKRLVELGVNVGVYHKGKDSTEFVTSITRDMPWMNTKNFNTGYCTQKTEKTDDDVVILAAALNGYVLSLGKLHEQVQEHGFHLQLFVTSPEAMFGEVYAERLIMVQLVKRRHHVSIFD